MTMQVLAKFQNSFQGGQLKKNASPPLSQSNFKKEPEFKNLQDLSVVPGKVKMGVFLSTLAGVSTALVLIMKKQNVGHDFSKIFTTSPKNWGLLKAKYEEKEILEIAAGSVGGGLLGGLLLDKKENTKAKIREAVIQAVGNVLIPIAFVSIGTRTFKKFKPQLLKHIPQIKGTSKTVTKLNSVLESLPSVVVSATSLISGVLLGNKIGNTINEKVFGVKDDRKIKKGDLAPHVDDLCLAASLVAEDNIIGKSVSRVVPAALMIAGIATGTAQEKPERLQKKNIAFSGGIPIDMNIKSVVLNESDNVKNVLLSIRPQVIKTNFRTEIVDISQFGTIYKAKRYINTTTNELAKVKFYDEKGKLSGLEEYGTDNKMLKKVAYNDNKDIVFETIYHAETGHPIKDTSFWSAGKVRSIAEKDFNTGNLITYTYYEKNGNLSSITDYNPITGLNKKLTDYTDGKISSIYDYDVEGNIKKLTTYDKDGNSKTTESRKW